MTHPTIPALPAPGDGDGRWIGTEWVPAEGAVVGGYRWADGMWVPLTGVTLDGQQWDGGHWVAAPFDPRGDAGARGRRSLRRRPALLVIAVLVLAELVALVVASQIRGSSPRARPSHWTPGAVGPAIALDLDRVPLAMAVDIKRGTVYVAGGDSAHGYSVEVVDSQHRPGPRIDLGASEPVGIAVDYRSAMLYVSRPEPGGCEIAAIDTAGSNAITSKHFPTGCGSLAIAPSGQRFLYVADATGRSLTKVSLATMTMSGRVETHERGTMLVDDGRERLYLGYSDPTTGDYLVRRLVTATWSRTASFSVHRPVSAITVDTMGVLWVADASAHVLVALEPDTGRELATIEVPGRISSLAVDTSRRVLYAADAENGKLYAIPIA